MLRRRKEVEDIGSRAVSITARREAIRQIIQTSRVESQEDLRRLLLKEGYDTTQATLSRDLARLGVRRVSTPGGGTAYELHESTEWPDASALASLQSLVRSVRHNGALVVLRTETGAASAVALAIDRAMLPEALGTLAGDDTIFLAPAPGTSAAQASSRLLQLLGRGNSR